MIDDFKSENYSDRISYSNESSNKQNDKLNINKIKEASEKENNNKSEIIQNKKKMLPIEKRSINHISLYIKNSVDGILTEKKSVLSKSDKQSESKSINSSISNGIKFIDRIGNNLLSNIRRSFRSERESYSRYNNSSMEINNNCLVCEEELTEEEKKDNLLECHHVCCNVCYFEYIKEKINSNQIDRIKCPQKDCQTILNNKFIEQKLFKDANILEKYIKL